jgi:hypothetical protein
LRNDEADQGLLLLIDKRGSVRSLAPKHVLVPFVRERLGHDPGRVDALFRRCGVDLAVIQALRDELRECLAWLPGNHPYPDDVLETGQRAIADGLIGVASELPDDVVVIFDESRPFEWDGIDTVAFAGEMVAQRFVAGTLGNRRNWEAFEAALADPAGHQHVTALMHGGVGFDSQSTEAAASMPVRAGALLAMRHLALIPHDPSRRVLRLVWLEHEMLIAPQPVAPASAPQSPPPPPPPPPGPVNALPDAPADVSPQAQALIDAAQDGAPFCEECARRAAELANA